MPNYWEERGIAYTGNGRKEIFKKIIELILNLLEFHLYRTGKNIDFVAKPEKLS